jgi:hypothetical protein
LGVSANDLTVAVPGRAGAALRARVAALARSADVRALAAVMGFVVLMTVLTWRRWGTPEIDAGAELTTAWQAAEGHPPYEDVRYFYGPLGVYALGAVFELFGATLSSAFALGLVLTAAIVVAFYALARQFVRPAAAGLSSAVLVAIGFSGTQFNFVLPHTNSATFGLLLLLLQLLALARGRPLLAGVAVGLACLTRVEFAAAALLAAGLWLAATWRVEGRGNALRATARLAPPALTIPVIVLGALAARVGADRLFWENLWPVDFLRAAGLRAYREWTPFDAASVASSLARAAAYAALLGGLTATSVLAARARGARERLRAAWPLAAAGLAVGLMLAAWRVAGVFGDARAAVEEEGRQLLLGMSVLPMLALAACALAAWCLVRGRRAPLSGSWALDLAVIGAAALLCSRAYDQFTMTSAAPYYAAPAVLLLGILHQRIGERWPAARLPVLAALGAVAVGIALYAVVALYADKTTVIHTAAGTYVGADDTAAAQQRALDLVRAGTAPGQPVLALPADGGIPFLAGRPPALYEVMFLPGLLDTPADERAAIALLKRRLVRYAIVSTRDTSAFDVGRFGRGYNRVLGDYLRSGGRPVVIGDPGAAVGGGYPSKGYRLYELPLPAR